jgi:hypothetical protein
VKNEGFWAILSRKCGNLENFKPKQWINKWNWDENGDFGAILCRKSGILEDFEPKMRKIGRNCVNNRKKK